MNYFVKKIAEGMLLGTLIVATLAIGPGNARASLGIDFSADVAGKGLVENGGPGTFGATSGFSIVGWSFRPTVDLFLTRLGVYDADRDRVHSEQHQVGVWSTGNQNSPLAYVTIDESKGNTPETSPGGSKFHFVNMVSPVVLTAGQTYFVGSTMYAGAVSGMGTADFDSFAAFNNGDSPATINPYLTYLGNAYAINATNSLVFPASTFGTDYTVGANIDVTPTPVPAAAWLLGSGLLGLVGIKRRNRA